MPFGVRRNMGARFGRKAVIYLSDRPRAENLMRLFVSIIALLRGELARKMRQGLRIFG